MLERDMPADGVGAMPELRDVDVADGEVCEADAEGAGAAAEERAQAVLLPVRLRDAVHVHAGLRPRVRVVFEADPRPLSSCRGV